MDLNTILAESEQAKLKELFAARSIMRAEVDKRAWQVVRELGYAPYQTESIAVKYIERGGLDIVQIDCEFEQRHQHESLHLELPIKHFEILVGTKFKKVE